MDITIAENIYLIEKPRSEIIDDMDRLSWGVSDCREKLAKATAEQVKDPSVYQLLPFFGIAQCFFKYRYAVAATDLFYMMLQENGLSQSQYLQKLETDTCARGDFEDRLDEESRMIFEMYDYSNYYGVREALVMLNICWYEDFEMDVIEVKNSPQVNVIEFIADPVAWELRNQEYSRYEEHWPQLIEVDSEECWENPALNYDGTVEACFSSSDEIIDLALSQIRKGGLR